MNKRLRKKMTKSKNLKRHLDILKVLSKSFTVENLLMQNEYYFYDLGFNGICYFSVKEIPDWQFAIWLRDKGNYNIFGCPNDLIDKFKPSSCELSYNQDSLAKFICELNQIIEEPIIKFVEAMGLKDKSTIDFEKAKTIYDNFYNEKRKRINEEENNRKKVFDFFRSILTMYNEVIKVGVVDGNLDGFSCTPRYNIRVLLSKNISDDMLEQIYNEINNLTYEVVDAYSEHQCSLHCVSTEESYIKNCDYIFCKNIVKGDGFNA